MSIKPVDMQVILPKSLEVIKADNNLSYRSDAQQQEFSQFFQKKTEGDNKQVLHTNQTEKNNIDRDGRNNNNSKQKKKKESSNNSESKKRNKTSTSMYDITI